MSRTLHSLKWAQGRNKELCPRSLAIPVRSLDKVDLGLENSLPSSFPFSVCKCVSQSDYQEGITDPEDRAPLPHGHFTETKLNESI